MSVLKKFFEIAILLTFMLFCINLTILYFGNTFIPESSVPLVENLAGDTNTMVVEDENGSYVLQAASLGTAPTEFKQCKKLQLKSVCNL